MARVTVFPEDGGVYSVYRASGLLTQLSLNFAAAPESQSEAMGEWVQLWYRTYHPRT